MQSSSAPSVAPLLDRFSERLNQECFCITLDRDALIKALEREVGDEALLREPSSRRGRISFPISRSSSLSRETGEMLRVVQAVEAAARAAWLSRRGLVLGSRDREG